MGHTWGANTLAALVMLLGATPVFGQQPSQAQINAIRQACRSDYMRVCASVPTGGAAALQCLQEHASATSPGCQQALLGGKPAVAAPSQPATSESTPSAAASTASQEAAPLWPHTFTSNGASVTVYQPQAISWPDRQTLTARTAIAIVRAGQGKQVLGQLQLSFTTHVDEATGTVTLSDPVLLQTHFPTLDTKQAEEMEAKIREALPSVQLPHVPLASVLLSLGQSPVASVAVNNDPPTIYYASRPASLVVFDGEPVLAPIGETGLSRAVNTNWEVFTDQGTWYLLNNGTWFSAPNATGPYTPVTHLPAGFASLPRDANFADARKYVPAPPPKPANQLPTIFVSMKPADIIVTSGEPQLAAVPGTGLKRVTNTPSALFFDPGTNRFYVLLSGRWFSAPGLNGPWEFATDKLPPDFALIPSEGPAAAVLPSVPGTVQAQEAVLKSQIPTMATLKRGVATIKVVYAGPPKFEPIPGTQILHAVNTASIVLKIGDRYYACENGAWFIATTPNGPWLLADSIPSAIKTIPPTSPLYPVTYVQVYGSSPTTVTYGYTAGYMMGFVSAGVLVYGTGYYYPPVVIPGPVPIYYPYPYSYVGNVYYNSSTGAWARGGTVYGPYGGAATGGRYYNPATGAWAQGGAIYGPYGGVGAWSAYNPSTGSYAHGSASWSNGSGVANGSFYNARTGVSGSTNQNWNPYGRWGSSTFAGPSQTVNTQSRSNANGSAGSFTSSTGAEGAGYHNRVTGNSGGAVRTQNGDVYAGHDGNVYQHTDNGWSKWSNGGWNPVQTPSSRPSSNNLSGTQANSASSGWRNSIDHNSYQQLQQDRLGREAGGGFENRFEGGGFGGRFGGGGRRFR